MTHPDSFLSKIDGEEFIKQRFFLNNLLGSHRTISDEDKLLEGLINLLDTIADYCTDELDIDCIIKKEEDT